MLTKTKLEKAKITKGYLIGKTVSQKTFIPTFPAEYTVCVFCWAQFSGYEEDLQEGFWESDSDSWICPRCLDRFAEPFGWTIKFKESGIDLLPYEDNYLDI
jgi:hypothetical protein